MVEIWQGLALDGVGVAASLGAALAYATYILMAERETTHRDPASLSFWGFAASLVAWAWLGETFGAAQLAGGGVVLAAILLAQTAR